MSDEAILKMDALIGDYTEKITGIRYDEQIKRWNISDIGLAQYAAMTLGIIIGGYISSFVIKHLRALIIIFVLLSIKPLYRFLK
ncbi:MAG: hypothetical protein KO464_02810 [Candidatus Methanofastidiosum sp.]|nr:hypothetical protein [Methanofastidiosum sp.]